MVTYNIDNLLDGFKELSLLSAAIYIDKYYTLSCSMTKVLSFYKYSHVNESNQMIFTTDEVIIGMPQKIRIPILFINELLRDNKKRFGGYYEPYR